MVLPDSLKIINEEAFDGCKGLNKVVFPEGLQIAQLQWVCSEKNNHSEICKENTLSCFWILLFCYRYNYSDSN